MHIFREIKALQAHLRLLRSTHSSVGLVPTMGALHEGHISLLKAARKQNNVIVCSIYVNPTQFNNPDDLKKYPRSIDADLDSLRSQNCDVVFCPDDAEMYGDADVGIAFPGLDNILEGEFRPGHFSGVAQVVAKLFHIVEPDHAYFGEKDFQQVVVIQRLVEALKFPVSIVTMPIVREPDGLAMSSRNRRLSPADRKQAIVLYDCLTYAREALVRHESFSSVQDAVRKKCSEHNAKLEYFCLADTRGLNLRNEIADPKNAILLIAAQVGPVRLIDNLRIQPD